MLVKMLIRMLVEKRSTHVTLRDVSDESIMCSRRNIQVRAFTPAFNPPYTKYQLSPKFLFVNTVTIIAKTQYMYTWTEIYSELNSFHICYIYSYNCMTIAVVIVPPYPHTEEPIAPIIWSLQPICLAVWKAGKVSERTSPSDCNREAQKDTKAHNWRGISLRQ